MEHKRRTGIPCQPDASVSQPSVPPYAPYGQQPGAPAFQPAEHPYGPYGQQPGSPAPQPCMPQPQPCPPMEHRKKRRFRFGPVSIFRTFLMLSGAVAWVFLILKYAVVPLLSLLSGNG